MLPHPRDALDESEVGGVIHTPGRPVTNCEDAVAVERDDMVDRPACLQCAITPSNTPLRAEGVLLPCA